MLIGSAAYKVTSPRAHGAAIPILPHVLGPLDRVAKQNVTWDQIEEHTDAVLAFGGMALKNSRVASGGVSHHVERGAMARAARRGCKFVCISPIRTDLSDEVQPQWLPVTPGTDTALMLGIGFCRNSAMRSGMTALPSPIRKPASKTGLLVTRLGL